MRVIDCLENLVRKLKSEGLSRPQLHILIALAKKGETMQMTQIVDQTSEIRQDIYRALTIMDGNLVTVKRPTRSRTYVTITAQGVETLNQFIKA